MKTLICLIHEKNVDLLLQRGRLLFFTGAILFFPGIAYFGTFITFGDKYLVFTDIGLVMSAMFAIIGLPLLLLAGAVLFKNRRTI